MISILKLKDLDNYIVNAKNVADVRSKANLIQRIRREHEEYKDKDPTVKDFSVFFSKYSEEKEVYTIILGLDPEDTYEEWFLKMEQDCLKEQSAIREDKDIYEHVLTGSMFSPEMSMSYLALLAFCKAFHNKCLKDPMLNDGVYCNFNYASTYQEAWHQYVNHPSSILNYTYAAKVAKVIVDLLPEFVVKDLKIRTDHIYMFHVLELLEERKSMRELCHLKPKDLLAKFRTQSRNFKDQKFSVNPNNLFHRSIEVKDSSKPIIPENQIDLFKKRVQEKLCLACGKEPFSKDHVCSAKDSYKQAAKAFRKNRCF